MEAKQSLIIFEDQYLIAVNKPAGILVVPTPTGKEHTLTNLLNKILGERTVKEKAHPCHRIDRDTSGIVLFAKNADVEQKMFEQFLKKQVRKKYIALVAGKPERRSGVITKKVEGMEAVTKYSVVKEMNGYSIVDVWPVTGRTNQIRIHFKEIGNPILGDRKFAFGRDFKVKFKRTALHSREISFRHPVTGRIILLKARIPEDMRKMM